MISLWSLLSADCNIQTGTPQNFSQSKSGVRKSSSWHTNYVVWSAKLYTSKFTVPATKQISCFLVKWQWFVVIVYKSPVVVKLQNNAVVLWTLCCTTGVLHSIALCISVCKVQGYVSVSYILNFEKKNMFIQVCGNYF